jgi:hypothetical protein
MYDYGVKLSTNGSQVCLSAIVIKSPGCSLARSSLAELDRIKGAFARVTNYRVVHAQASNPKGL